MRNFTANSNMQICRTKFATCTVFCATRSSVRSLRSNFQDLPIHPSCKTKTYGDRAFSVCAPKIWDTVSLEIRQSSTV